MAYTVIKPVRDKDEYVIWSSMFDSPVVVGDRQEILDWLVETSDYKEEIALPRSIERLNRADETSSSALYYSPSWEKEDEFIFQQSGWVSRENIGILAHLLEEGVPDDDPRIIELLTPMEDDS